MIIYKVTNLINNKSYIGQTQLTIQNRKLNHIDSVNNNSNTNFHNALRKYNDKNFKWDILYECTSKDELNEKEQYYIKKYDTFKNGYNMTLGGTGGLTYKQGDDLYKKLKIDGKLGRWKNGLSYSDKNPGATKEAIEKRMKTFSKKKSFEYIRGRHHPNYGKSRNNININGKNNGMYGKYPHCVSVEIDDVIYESYGEASRKLGWSRSTIRNRCKNNNFKKWKILNVTKQTKF